MNSEVLQKGYSACDLDQLIFHIEYLHLIPTFKDGRISIFDLSKLTSAVSVRSFCRCKTNIICKSIIDTFLKCPFFLLRRYFRETQTYKQCYYKIYFFHFNFNSNSNSICQRMCQYHKIHIINVYNKMNILDAVKILDSCMCKIVTIPENFR